MILRERKKDVTNIKALSVPNRYRLEVGEVVATAT